ncbi:30S ribosomal protein S6 alpha, chloroplastic [Ricinus communis]|uniref:Structural constituent of ribosome, putative n=1 Tax=Ricinus communis TaxID=3988 RepID=B9RYN6_RICCO|nr:30S ribosomal protein S6 alpha, chloroplastic [Ricinus communis]EEF43388.1 structural constituent of ribosome, putative [Ricinus communis]|eukprot:XP_002518855.1 30S ribosomal protein S6 alpha, chloroplastic [Ricinus communis]
MASSSSCSSSLLTPTVINSSPLCPKLFSKFPCFPSLSFAHTIKKRHSVRSLTIKSQALDFSGSFYEGSGFGSEEDPPTLTGSGMTAVEDKEPPQCPPGLRQYETMAVLRPDMSEDERLALTQKYEELLVAGGGMYVEVFNRGVIPLAYSIKKKNKAGETNTYLDGIYLLFTYFTKPESIEMLEATLNTDDDIIRSSSFKIRKRKF